LEDGCGSHGVDERGALFSGKASFFEGALDLSGGEALVPKDNRKVGEFFEAFGEGADLKGEGTLFAIKVERKADDDLFDGAIGCKFSEDLL
jgi:hypothetical protein